jgi:hypothetical protein
MNKTVLGTILLLITLPPCPAQELNCDITVNMESIPSSDRDYLKNFKSDLERYLNSTHYTNEELYGEKIQVSMTIFFTAVTANNRYRAEVFIGSQRPIYVGNDKSEKVTPILRIKDDKWEFTYMPNQRMYFDEFTFDPLTDFLDYYAFIIIGFDLETYKQLDGSRAFQKALTLANGAMATSSAADWQSSSAFSKYGFAEELNNAKFQPIRLAYFSYHFEGIDLLGTENRKGLDNMLLALESIWKVRQQNPLSLFVRQLFDSKYKEIAEMFRTYPDASVYEKLATYDPEHRSVYIETRSNR